MANVSQRSANSRVVQSYSHREQLKLPAITPANKQAIAATLERSAKTSTI
jgi:hypothetical protein